MTPPVPMRLIAYSHSLKYLCTNVIVGTEPICQPFIIKSTFGVAGLHVL